MDITLRLAWRNLWRQPRRTWLTTGAMVFSNFLLVFMISLQFGMYGMMIDNTLQVFSGHLQVQAPGYLDDQKMRQVVPDVVPLANRDGARYGRGARLGVWPGVERGTQLRHRHLWRRTRLRTTSVEYSGPASEGPLP